MSFKQFFCLFLFFTSVVACKKIQKEKPVPAERSACAVTEMLGHPFGTMLDLSVQIVDGDSIDSKGLSGLYLFKIDSINNVPYSDTLFMEFQDQTGHFPADDIALSRYVYGNDSGRNSDEAYNSMKKNYVGKKFRVIAFETGSFTGVPDGYFDYQPIAQTTGFYFKNALVVVALHGDPKRKTLLGKTS